MIKKNVLWLCALMSGLLTSQPVLAISDVTFYVVDFRPHIMVKENEPIEGADVSVVKRAFAEVGITVHLETLPWNRIIKLMRFGDIAGTLSCSKRDYRQNYILFSDPISYIEPIAISKKSLDTSRIRRLSDLTHFSVTTVRDWALQTQLMQLGIAHKAAPSIESAIRSVYYRDVEVMYMSEAPARYYMTQLGLQDEMKVTPFRDEDLSLALHLCISKNFPGADQLLEKFNTGLRAIKSDS